MGSCNKLHTHNIPIEMDVNVDTFPPPLSPIHVSFTKQRFVNLHHGLGFTVFLENEWKNEN
jgi:hypothetical protein